ncbi:MAG TPA: TlpA disulfide reductase family protein [Virgibacillus sp.]|nr:TlpA disulfide reductase family protein [Virgibacillus sp.]HLR69164.1 TlpA disulfide reductase family protein [Virgibacillus sp.]
MKKIIITVIIAGMLGFTVYKFIADSKEPTLEEQADSISDNTIVSPPKEDGEEITKSDDEGLDKGQKAPDFELSTLDGETVKLSDFRGQKVLLNFWATWCPPCRKEMPDMEELHNDTDVKILAVNLTGTESGLDEVKSFIDKLELTFTIPLDEESDIANQYEVVAYPTTYMIDPDGHIHFKSLGALTYDQMKQEVEKME